MEQPSNEPEEIVDLPPLPPSPSNDEEEALEK